MIKSMKVPPECPEHLKLDKVAGDSQKIGEFLDWLFNDQHFTLAKRPQSFPHGTPIDSIYVRVGIVPVAKSINELLSEYYGIDQKKLEEEKQQMLAYLREANKR